MTAADILELPHRRPSAPAIPTVGEETPLAQVLALLLDSPTQTLRVSDGEQCAGTIDMPRALEACSLLMPQREESCTLEVCCSPGEYQASALARAVEDADAHLLELLSRPAPGGNIAVQIRCSRRDPAPVARQLERYGFTVTNMQGEASATPDVAEERMAALRRYLEI